MIKILLWISLFSLTAEAKPLMTFTYVPNEGADPMACEYGQIRDLPDYDVNCGNGQKKFSAHVIVRNMQAEKSSAFEILYWVTEPGEAAKGPRFNATSTWMHFKTKTDLAQISLSQAVENDYASLMLDWVP